jgi:energy-coupling factor transporter ATP-binding protein EcfA2
MSIIKKNKQLVILGPAGSGKTTTINRVALDNASKFIKHRSDGYIPIIVPLRDYGTNGLQEVIGSILKRWAITLEHIEGDLRAGKFLIIFDGLNEVSSKLRSQCFQEIRSFSREYSLNRFIYTSRSFEYQDDWVSLDDQNLVLACEIEALTRDQIEDCIQRYFGNRKKLASQLIEELQVRQQDVWENNKSLARLARTPLLLQMLILTFEEKKRIPRSEGELLLGFVDEILLRERSKAAAEINPDVKKALLATIALKMYQEEISSIDKRYAFSVFSKRLAELKQSGLAKKSYESTEIWEELQKNSLIIDDGDLVYWPHPLYQEIFVGLSLRDMCFEDNGEPKFKGIYVQFHSIKAKWHGNPSFDAGLRMLEVIPQHQRLDGLAVIATVNPALAKEAFLQFEPDYNPGMIEEFSIILRKFLLSIKWEGELHRNLLIAASYISQGYFCPLFTDGATLCPTWEGREQSAIFLWSRCEKTLALEVMKQLCSNDLEARVRKTAFNILTQSEENPDEKTYSFLVQRLFQENQGFLLDPQLLIKKILDSEFVINLLVDIVRSENDINRKLRAIWCLGKSEANYLTVQNILIELTRKSINEDIRRETVNALAAYSSDLSVKAVSDRVREDKAKSVRIAAIGCLHRLQSAKALSSIVSALDDVEEDVSDEAVKALVDISKKQKRVVTILLRCLKQDNSKSKQLLALSRISIDESDSRIQAKICKELQFHKNEKDKYIRLEIALALRTYDLSLSNGILRELSNDQDTKFRKYAQERLSEWEIEL